MTRGGHDGHDGVHGHDVQRRGVHGYGQQGDDAPIPGVQDADVQGPDDPGTRGYERQGREASGEGRGGGPYGAGERGRAAGGRGGRHGRGARRRPYGQDGPQEPRSSAAPRTEAAQGPDAPDTPRRRRRWSRQRGYTGHPGADASGEPYGPDEAGDGTGDEAVTGTYAREPVLTAPAPGPEPESGSEDARAEGEEPRRGRAGGLLVALLAIVAAGLAAAVTLAYLDLRTLRQSEADGAAALAAARSYASDMLAYDHRHIEQDLARAQGHATDRLAGYYRQLAATLVPEARREQTVQQVTVAGAAVESASPDRVRVLMLINRTTSKLPPGHKSRRGEVNQGRVRFVMVKRGDGAWLVDDLSTLLGNPPART